VQTNSILLFRRTCKLIQFFGTEKCASQLNTSVQKSTQTNVVLLYRRMCELIQFFDTEERANQFNTSVQKNKQINSVLLYRRMCKLIQSSHPFTRSPQAHSIGLFLLLPSIFKQLDFTSCCLAVFKSYTNFDLTPSVDMTGVRKSSQRICDFFRNFQKSKEILA
jgi:hypothetical protein